VDLESILPSSAVNGIWIQENTAANFLQDPPNPSQNLPIWVKSAMESLKNCELFPP
jgi:hypothetical protein